MLGDQTAVVTKEDNGLGGGSGGVDKQEPTEERFSKCS